MYACLSHKLLFVRKALEILFFTLENIKSVILRQMFYDYAYFIIHRVFQNDNEIKIPNLREDFESSMKVWFFKSNIRKRFLVSIQNKHS